MDTASISPVATNLQNIRDVVTVNGGPGVDSLTINDQGNQDDRKYVLSAASLAVGPIAGVATPRVSYDLVGNEDALVVNGGSGDNSYEVLSTADLFQTTLNHGRGSDAVAVRATTGPLNVAGTGLLGVFSSVLVGSANGVQDIHGNVTVTNSPGLTMLTVANLGDSTDHLVAIDQFAIRGLAPAEIRYAQGNLVGLNIIGGNGASTYVFLNTPSVTAPGFTTLDCNGFDEVDVNRTTGALDIHDAPEVNLFGITPGLGLQEIRGRVTVFDAGLLTVDDSDDTASRSATLTNDSLTGLAGADVRFANLGELVVRGGSNGNTFNVTITPLAPTTIFSGTGLDTVNVRATVAPLVINGQAGVDAVAIGNAGSVQDIVGGIVVTNAGTPGNTKSLTIDDSANPIPKGTVALPVLVTNASLLRLAPADILYSGVMLLTVTGGRGGNVFAIGSTAALATTTVNAGSGVNAVLVGGGTIAGIQGPLTVSGGNALSAIEVDDRASPLNLLRTYTVTSASVARGADPVVTAPIFYSNARTLTIDGSGSFAVLSTGLTTILNVPGGASVVVGNTLSGAQEVRGALDIASLDGGPIAVTVNNSSDFVSRTATATASAVTGLAAAAISYALPALSTLTLIGGGTGGNVFNVQSIALGTAYAIVAGVSDDVVNAGSPTNSLHEFFGTLAVVGGAGGNILTINDQGNLANPARTYTITPTSVVRTGAGDPNNPVTITYAGIRTLTLNGSSSYNVVDTPAGTATTLNAGTTDDTITIDDNHGPLIVNAGDGADTIRLRGCSDLVTLSGGAGIDTISIGDASNRLNSIQGPAVTVNGNDAADTLNVNDQGVASSQTYTITSTTVTASGVAPITYATIETLVVNGGTGGNTVTVNSTANGVSTTVNTGSGNDAIAILGNLGGLTVDGVSSLDTVSIGRASSVQGMGATVTLRNAAGLMNVTVDNGADTQPRTVSVSSAGITGLAPGAINYVQNDLVSLTVNFGNGGNTINVVNTPGRPTLILPISFNTGNGTDSVHVRATAATSILNIVTGGGSNTVNVGSDGPPPVAASTINGIAGAVTINGAGGVTVLNVNDQGNPANAARVYTNNGAVVTRAGDPVVPAAINYAALRRITINGSSNYVITGTAADATTVINAGDGDDTIQVMGTSPTGPLVVNAGNGDDLIDVQAIGAGGKVTVDGGLRYDTIRLGQAAISTDALDFTNVELVRIANTGALIVTRPLRVFELSLEGGTLTGASDVTVDHSFVWSSGTSSGGGPTRIALGATLLIAGPAGGNNNSRPLENAGTITWANAAAGLGGVATTPIINLPTGLIGGTGTLTGALANDGVVAPGGLIAVGTISVVGTYEQTPNGVLAVDLGPDPGVPFDQLFATGGARLAGRLRIASVGQPPIGSAYTIVVAPVVLGRFGSLEGQGLADLNLDGIDDVFFVAVYNPGDATLLVRSPDRLPPLRPTLDLPDDLDTGRSNQDNVTFLSLLTFVVSAEAGSSVVIGDGNTAIDGPFIMPAVGFTFRTFVLGHGTHLLSATATDFEGNRSPQSEELIVVVDLIAPDAPSTPDLLASADSGSDATDNVTNINSPAFQGVAEANAIIRIGASVFGEAVGEGVVGSDGTDGAFGNGFGSWEVTIEPITDGLDSIFAQAEDLAGNLSFVSGALTVYIDTVAPNTPYLDLLDASDTGNKFDNVTFAAPQNFTVTISDVPGSPTNPSPNDVLYRLFDRTGAAPEALVSSSGLDTKALVPVTLNLADGVHNLKLEAEDRAGNLSHDFLLEVVKISVSGQGPSSVSALSASSLSSDRPVIAQGFVRSRNERKTFTFVPTETGRVSIDATAPGSKLDTNLVVQDSRGRVLARNNDFRRGVTDSHVELNVAAGRSYSLIITGARRTTGFFELLADVARDRMQDEHADVTKRASALSVAKAGASVAGLIGHVGDADIFRVAPTISGRLKVSATPRDNFLDPVVEIRSTRGQSSLARNLSSSAATESSQVFDVTAGQSYFVTVRGRGGRRGAYQLALDWLS